MVPGQIHHSKKSKEVHRRIDVHRLHMQTIELLSTSVICRYTEIPDLKTLDTTRDIRNKKKNTISSLDYAKEI